LPKAWQVVTDALAAAWQSKPLGREALSEAKPGEGGGTVTSSRDRPAEENGQHNRPHSLCKPEILKHSKYFLELEFCDL